MLVGVARGLAGSRLGGTATSGPLLCALLGLLEAVGIAFDGDDLGVVDEAVDQRDDAGGVGKDLPPLGKGAVGDDGAAGEVAAGHQSNIRSACRLE